MDKKRCEYCFSDISKRAKVCRFCKRICTEHLVDVLRIDAMFLQLIQELSVESEARMRGQAHEREEIVREGC